MDNSQYIGALRCVPVGEINEWETHWDQLVEESSVGWILHSRLWHNVMLEILSGSNVSDRSFFLVHPDSGPVALCPLLISDVRYGGETFREAGFNGAGLPWPCISATGQLPDGILRHAINEAERLSRLNGAEKISFMSSSPESTADSYWYKELMASLPYLDASYESHLVNINSDTLLTVRERYRRYVKKYSKLVATNIVYGEAVTAAIEQSYFELHVKDAGGQYRSRDSYKMMADMARNGGGFFVVATSHETKNILGVLLILMHKLSAYDASVGVDPDHQDKFVSHLMKWNAIKHLQELGVSHYELGIVSNSARFERIPSQKEKGISMFKSGWSRNRTKRVLVAERFLNINSLHRWMQAKESALRSHMFES
jgi:hypothetical protein